ncbi:MAG: redox-regulated ATPase YchF, partial [Caldilineaceae bacterium]|nr:redox-regulated ATPase YchF [Caldilineaceae bacterium]
TGKKVIYVANVDEEHLGSGNEYVEEARRVADEHNAEFVVLCAKLEQDMAGLSDEERHEFLSAMDISETGLEQVIRKGYHALDLISFFTAGPKEVRAWTVRQGARAPDAAGVIHTDFERGFIRAEVIPYDTYVRLGSEQAAKAAGEMRVEGREYVVQDGDVMHFRFNV